MIGEAENGAAAGEMSFAAGREALRKWTVLPAETTPLERLHHIMLACATRADSSELRQLFPMPATGGGRPVVLQYVQVRHAPQDCGWFQPTRRVCGWVIPPTGAITPLPFRHHSLQDDLPSSAPPLGQSFVGSLLLAYGPQVKADTGAACLELDLRYRRKRLTSIVDKPPRLTNPVAFLERLHYRGIVNGRPRTAGFLLRLNAALASLFEVGERSWLDINHRFQLDWRRLPRSRQALAIVLLDAARHVLEASVGLFDPWSQPGVAVLDRPEQWCLSADLSEFMLLLDRLFSRMQFILRLNAPARGAFPRQLLSGVLRIPQPKRRPPPPPKATVPRSTVLLVDVDGAMPNLALMKLSQHFKKSGQRVALVRAQKPLPEVDSVLASSIFHTETSARRIAVLQQRYGDRLQLGGSGISLETRLPRVVEDLEADYSLYPNLADRAIGFLTRGCPRRCPFCVVPVKEGKPRLVSDLSSVLQGRSKLILLDDNLLAHPEAEALLEQMAELDLAVNFNQTLDLRLLTPATASLLRRIRCSNAAFTRRCYHFSLNDSRGFDTIRKRLELLQVTPKDNVEFVCMYGFRSTLAADLERFRFLRSLPRSYVFVQRYQRIPGGPEPELEGFFNEQAEANLDALVRIVFAQNMKSMEVYYRWLCLLYARQCGRIHAGLVGTLFRYNNRQRHAAFIAELQAICSGKDQRVTASAMA
jgi:hypothetical protein